MMTVVRRRSLPPTAGIARCGQLALMAVLVLCGLITPVSLRAGEPTGGTPVLPGDALLNTPVGGLERTNATAEVVPVTGQPFPKALRVTIRADAPETNATQLTMPISAPVERGDALLASFSVRGSSVNGKSPAMVELLFERAVDPWTKSLTQDAPAPKEPKAWKRVVAAFTAAESYRPGEAMVSLRFAFGPQTVEVGGLSVVNFGKTRKVEDLVGLAAEQNPLGAATVAVNLADKKQTMLGFGGDFCQPRYGATEPMDAVGAYNLSHLHVVHARVGIPLNWWTPEKGVYRDEAQAHAAFLAMQEFTRRKIPIAASVWEGPTWLLGGRAEQSSRVLPPEKYADCIEAIAQFLVTARDRYGVTVDTFSFNEADYGVNFKFTSETIADFIRQAGPRFRALGLKTKFLVGDTGGGMEVVGYARPLLEDRSLAPYLGPLAFHCWDVLGAPDARYEAIAALGKEFDKPVWCTEAGHDAGLWQQPNPWASWDNALRTALAYAKTLRLTGASLMDYWTYQDNYPLVNREGTQPYPVFTILQQMEDALPPGSRIVSAAADRDELRVLAASGPEAGQCSVLLVNPIGAGKVTLTGLPPGARASVITSTTTALRKATAEEVSREGQMTITVPTRSVVTVLLRL